MINIVIPMAGEGTRFRDAGYAKPKPFIDVLGKPMIEWVLENLKYEDAHYYLIARSEHLEDEKLSVQSLEAKFKITWIPIDELTEGAACTVLKCEKFINNKTPLVLANSDQFVDFSFSNFIDDALKRELDGSILTFTDTNPKWSFAKLNGEYVIEVREKEPISDIATVGIYYFKSGLSYVSAAKAMIAANDRVNNEFYNCPVYNYLIRNQKKIGVFHIKKEQMHGLGTPEDLESFISQN